ncbi:MAG TPA: Clp protease N-terminal domain-containing protein [Gemmataceae bacterium]|nr:Clp protease N-terminal domain-containing protein [Gemmataceae bacterium]
MYERFTDRARKVMQLASQEAQRFNHEYIGTEHILLGLIKEGSGVGANVLKNLDVDLRKVRLEVEKIVQTGPTWPQVVLGKLPQTPRAKKVIEYSVDEARNLNHNYVGTEHLLLGLLREQEGVAAQVLMNLGLKLEDVRQEVLNLLGHNLSEVGHPHLNVIRSKTPALNDVGRDLTELAGRDKLAPLFGRAEELRAVCEVLSCRDQCNPVILGEPGVGRWTLVAGLARAIATRRVPETLRNHRIVEVPLSRLWTSARNPARVAYHAQCVINEVRRAKDTVLFLPDAVASLGSRAGGSAAERVHAELVLALWGTRTPIILIATPSEHRRCLARWPALVACIQPIVLRPSSVEETVAILRANCNRYEKHHDVRFADVALTDIAESADRQLPGALPGKAVRLLDRAAARARMKAWQLAPDIDLAVHEAEQQIERLNRHKEDAVAAQDFQRGAELRDQADKLKKERERLLREHQERAHPRDVVVDAGVVAEVVRDLADDILPEPASA